MAMTWPKARPSMVIAAPDHLVHEKVLKALNSYNRERILGMLTEMKGGEFGSLEAFHCGKQVARLLTHSDTRISAAAAGCLSLMGPEGRDYQEQLAEAAQSQSPEVRAAAVQAMGRLRINPEAVESAAGDPDPLVRAQVCSTIAEMEDTGLHKTAAKLLTDSSPSVKAAAVGAIGALMGASQEMHSVYVAQAAELLQPILADPQTKGAALDAVARMGEGLPEFCASAAVEALGDKDCFTRQSAVAAVEVLAGDVAKAKGLLPKLESLLKDTDPGVRAAAASALAALGEKASGSAAALAALLTDKEEDQSGLAFVIGNGGRRMAPQLRRPKCAAVTALSRIGGEKNAQLVSQALNDVAWEVRLSAAEGLGFMKKGAKKEVSALLGSLEDDAFPVRAMVCYALGQVGEVEAVPRLAEALEDGAYSVRLSAVQAIGLVPDAAAEYAHEIFKLTEDPVPQVKAEALTALAGLGAIGQGYAGVAMTMLNEEDAVVRAAACEALGGMGDAGFACAEEVQELLDDPVPSVQQAAVASLEKMGLLVPPQMKDFGKGRGVPNDTPALLPGYINFEGMGGFYNDVMQKKNVLLGEGKWVEGLV